MNNEFDDEPDVVETALMDWQEVLSLHGLDMEEFSQTDLYEEESQKTDAEAKRKPREYLELKNKKRRGREGGTD